MASVLKVAAGHPRKQVDGALPLVSLVLHRIVHLDRPHFRPPPPYGVLFPHARSIQAWHPYVDGLLRRVSRHAPLVDLRVSGVFEVTSVSIQRTETGVSMRGE